MTEEQFDEVFYRAQELQKGILYREEVISIEKAIEKIEFGGANQEATITQAAYLINLISMDITGEYDPNLLVQIREHYLKNVEIII